jgi:hypothetical protein
LGPARLAQAQHALAEHYELEGKIAEAKMYYEMTCTGMDKAQLPPDAEPELKRHYFLEKAGYYSNYAICLVRGCSWFCPPWSCRPCLIAAFSLFQAKNNEHKASIAKRQAVVQFMKEHFGSTSPYMRYPIGSAELPASAHPHLT